ncbi:MAG: hypothetical protein K6T91_07365 [Firmicutes bacterium]|nr:hypothetical protein [Bacillota bacterium]
MAEVRRERHLEERAGVREPIPEAARLRDRVRWGPIWAGVILVIAGQILLTSVGVAIILATMPVTSITGLRQASTAIGIWTAVSLVVSLFIGGYAAGRLMPVDTRGIGMAHGLMVWALMLALVGLVLLIGLGIAAAVSGAAITTAGINIGVFARSAASEIGWFTFWTVLALGAAVLGGYLGMYSNQTSSKALY